MADRIVFCKRRKSGVTATQEAERILQFCYGDKEEAKRMCNTLFGPYTRYFGYPQWQDAVVKQIDSLNVTFKKIR